MRKIFSLCPSRRPDSHPIPSPGGPRCRGKGRRGTIKSWPQEVTSHLVIQDLPFPNHQNWKAPYKSLRPLFNRWKNRPRERKKFSQDPRVPKTRLTNRLHLRCQLWSIGSSYLTALSLGSLTGRGGKEYQTQFILPPWEGLRRYSSIDVTEEDNGKNALLTRLCLLPKRFNDVQRRWLQSKSKRLKGTKTSHPKL